MVKYQKCDRCKKPDITGTLGCRRLQLCPKCASDAFKIPEPQIRAKLLRLKANKDAMAYLEQS